MFGLERNCEEAENEEFPDRLSSRPKAKVPSWLRQRTVKTGIR